MKVKEDLQENRIRAEQDLEFFINLVHPNRMLGQIHKELISWMTREEAKTHQLILLPRDHMKSALMAYRVAWEITKNPDIRILYVSATSTLAVKQLDFIKQILTSEEYTKYWPEMVNQQPSKRRKWTETEISVDHPKRAEEFIRDSTVFCAGLVTTVTGLHCDIVVFDDIVIDENAYKKEERQKVKTRASYYASIAGTDGRCWAVGTRYFPDDYYNTMLEMVVEEVDKDGNIIGSEYLYEVFERKVETAGDGTGEFLWPRQRRSDGKWFGFNSQVLAKKRAQYTDRGKFRAQYYNDPEDPESAPIKADQFQYYDRNLLVYSGGSWFFSGRRLNVFAAIDFAFSTTQNADWTALVVVGVDNQNNYFVLDIDRFKTDRLSVYFERILRAFNKWKFRKLRAETTVAQAVIIKNLKENYIKPNGLLLSIDAHRPTKDKESRILGTLEPRYSNSQVWHYKGGNCELLEDELTRAKPQHDDLKDALANAIDVSSPPGNSSGMAFNSGMMATSTPLSKMYNSRFGGIS